jgi:hypothetical protein
VSPREIQNKLIAEIDRRMEECERGLLAVGTDENDLPVAALTLVAPSSIYYTHVLALLPDGSPFIYDAGLN